LKNEGNNNVMTAYIANHQKKKRIFAKREQELEHAIKNNLSLEKIIRAAEKLREAKLNVFKCEFSKDSVLPAHCYVPKDEAKVWENYSVDEIIEKYRTSLN
jgi:hypothetical protein